MTRRRSQYRAREGGVQVDQRRARGSSPRLTRAYTMLPGQQPKDVRLYRFPKVVDVPDAIVDRSLTALGGQADFNEPDIDVEHVARSGHAEASLPVALAVLDDGMCIRAFSGVDDLTGGRFDHRGRLHLLANVVLNASMTTKARPSARILQKLSTSDATGIGRGRPTFEALLSVRLGRMSGTRNE